MKKLLVIALVLAAAGLSPDRQPKPVPLQRQGGAGVRRAAVPRLRGEDVRPRHSPLAQPRPSRGAVPQPVPVLLLRRQPDQLCRPRRDGYMEHK